MSRCSQPVVRVSLGVREMWKGVTPKNQNAYIYIFLFSKICCFNLLLEKIVERVIERLETAALFDTLWQGSAFHFYTLVQPQM